MLIDVIVFVVDVVVWFIEVFFDVIVFGDVVDKLLGDI